MKKLIYFSILVFSIICISCNSDDDYYSRLPPETQTGENTFVCLIDGKLFYPRDGYRGLGGSGARAIRFIASGLSPNFTSRHLNVNNYRDGKPINNFTLQIHNIDQIGEGNYEFKLSNFKRGIDSPPHTHLYVRAYHEPSGGFKWYGTTDNSGTLVITRFDLSNRIISGTFSGILKERNGEETVTITDGRFDINLSTIANEIFP